MRDTLMDRMGVQPILPIKVLVTIDHWYINGDFDSHGAGHVICKPHLITSLQIISTKNQNFLQTNPSKFVKCML